MELPNNIVEYLDGIPQVELEQYLDKRKGRLSEAKQGRMEG